MGPTPVFSDRNFFFSLARAVKRCVYVLLYDISSLSLLSFSLHLKDEILNCVYHHHTLYDLHLRKLALLTWTGNLFLIIPKTQKHTKRTRRDFQFAGCALLFTFHFDWRAEAKKKSIEFKQPANVERCARAGSIDRCVKKLFKIYSQAKLSRLGFKRQQLRFEMKLLARDVNAKKFKVTTHRARDCCGAIK